MIFETYSSQNTNNSASSSDSNSSGSLINQLYAQKKGNLPQKEEKSSVGAKQYSGTLN